MKNESILKVWDINDGKLLKSIQTGLSLVWPVLALSNDQVAIGESGRTGSIKVIDLEDDSKTRVKDRAHDVGVVCLWQLSNENLVSAGQDGDSSTPILTIKVWNYSDLSLLQQIKTDHSTSIMSLSISGDEKLLASGSGDHSARLWPIEEYK